MRRLVPAPGRVLVQKERVDNTLKSKSGSAIVNAEGKALVMGDAEVETVQRWKKEALLLAVGPDEVTDYGTVISCPFTPGQTVIVAPTSGMDIQIGGETVTVLRFGELIGAFEDVPDLVVPFSGVAL